MAVHGAVICLPVWGAGFGGEATHAGVCSGSGVLAWGGSAHAANGGCARRRPGGAGDSSVAPTEAARRRRSGSHRGGSWCGDLFHLAMETVVADPAGHSGRLLLLPGQLAVEGLATVEPIQHMR